MTWLVYRPSPPTCVWLAAYLYQATGTCADRCSAVSHNLVYLSLQFHGLLSMFMHLCPCRIRGNGEVIKREEFDQRKAAAEAARLARLQRKPQKLVSQGKNLDGYPLLQVIASGSVHELCTQAMHSTTSRFLGGPRLGYFCKHCCIKRLVYITALMLCASFVLEVTGDCTMFAGLAGSRGGCEQWEAGNHHLHQGQECTWAGGRCSTCCMLFQALPESSGAT
jgi:hypothetical protein